MEASKVVPACHDILMFGLVSRYRSTCGCCEVGESEAHRNKATFGESIRGACSKFAALRSARKDHLGEHGYLFTRLDFSTSCHYLLGAGIVIEENIIEIHTKGFRKGEW
jgi:hypothetical protein